MNQNMEEWKIRIKEFLSVKKNMALVGVILAGVVIGSVMLGLTSSGEQETSDTNETETMLVSDESVPEKIGTVVLDYCKYEYNTRTKTAKMIEAKPQNEVLIIPSTIEVEGETYAVVALQEHVFENQEKIHEVTIPDTVKDIGKAAFKGCVNLTNVQLPNGIEALEDSLFENCNKLVTITIPSSVKEIGEKTFSYCYKLRDVNILGEITKLGKNAFTSCGSLTWVELPETLAIPDGVFGGSAYGQDEPETIIVDGFEYKYNRVHKSVKLAGVQGGEQAHIVIPSQVTINDEEYTVMELINSFAGSEWLVSIKIPDTITKISEGYFKGCVNLEEAELPDSITELGRDIFSGCTSLKQLRFPNGLETVPVGAFYGCTALETVVLPETIQIIGNSAFENCSNLRNINIPASVTDVASQAFAGCSSLGNITFPETAYVDEKVFVAKEEEQSGGNWVELTHEELKYIVDYEKGVAHVVGIVLANYMSSDIVVPSELTINGTTVFVTEIRAEAFRNREDILTITVSEGIIRIHDKAFENCVSLRSAKLPFSLTRIGDRAFAGCSSLMKVEMPGDTAIGSDVFVGCHENMMLY